MSAAGWLNAAWMLKCVPEATAFRRATRRVRQAQEAVLRRIVRRNRDTGFGRRHGFEQIGDARAFQRRVPPARYEDFAPLVERIAAGKPNVLCRQRVTLLEPTSGTTRGEKLIPYTAALRREFQRAVAAWMADLLRRRPAVRRGRAYWSISPALSAPRRSPGGIPIGFDDDASYLGGWEQWALARLLAAPAALARIPQLDAFRYCTLLFLLRARDLSLISIWNPTFLPALLADLDAWAERLVDDLRRGTLSPPEELPEAVAGRLQSALRGAPRRAGEVADALRASAALPQRLRAVWPDLALVSCWADAAAARYVGAVRELFPDVEIQPKGLIATEGCVSFPLVDQPAPVLAVRSHFFEFQETGGDAAPCRLAHELEPGGCYRVVLTTGGGLYRYQLGDEVEVVGHLHEAPLLRFLGKADRVSDLVGEKLAEPHVRAALDRLFARHGLAPTFALLVPVEGRPPCYRLYLQLAAAPPPDAAHLAAELHCELEANPHYRYAARLGQLGPAGLALLDPAGEPGWQVYQRRCRARGQKAGDIKPAALDPGLDWPQAFAPQPGAAVP